VKFQPVISDGWIYAGSKEGKLISFNTGNPSLTGWPMWSMNATHNPVVE
jgi:outer membrane protein assembly factor BamB